MRPCFVLGMEQDGRIDLYGLNEAGQPVQYGRLQDGKMQLTVNPWRESGYDELAAVAQQMNKQARPGERPVGVYLLDLRYAPYALGRVRREAVGAP